MVALLKFPIWFCLLPLKGLSNNSDKFNIDFQQHDYKMKFEHADVVKYDKNYVEHIRLVTFKYNRTCTAFNITAVLKIDLGYKLEIVVQTYKFASNEYRLFPMRFEVNACDAISKDSFGFGDMGRSCGNFTGCPLMKDKRYHICNFTPNESRFPPLIPNGRYMTELQMLYLSTELGVIRFYDEIYRLFVVK